MIEAAFIAFQMGAAGDKTFGQYIEALGLTDKQEPPKPKRTKEDILKGVEKTFEMMRNQSAKSANLE